MTQKSTPRAKLIRPDDPGHGVTFDRFTEIVSSAWLEKVERTLGFEGPNDDFRRSLVRLFWHFYRNSLPEGGVKFYRDDLKKELQRAAGLAEKLEVSAARIWQSQDPAIFDLLRPLAAMAQEPNPPHPSGVAWIGWLRAFASTTKLLADTLLDDPGGPRPAIPFDELAICLVPYCRGPDGTPPSEARYFAFVASVVDFLRTIEKRLPAAKFRLPVTDRALRQRLRLLTARTSSVT